MNSSKSTGCLLFECLVKLSSEATGSWASLDGTLGLTASVSLSALGLGLLEFLFEGDVIAGNIFLAELIN